MSALANGKKVKALLNEISLSENEGRCLTFLVKMLASIQHMNSDVYASRKAQALFLMSL